MLDVLLVAEKPSVGRSIAPLMGRVTKDEKTFIEIDGGRIVITWCFGSIFDLAPPDHYWGEKKRWSFELLPVIPEQSKLICSEPNQFRIIKSFVSKAKVVINAGDPDREGQLIIDDALFQSGVNPYRDNFKRIWLAALNDEGIKKSLANLTPNSPNEFLYRAAQCRREADWLTGMNGTMAYTVKTGVLCNLGRVKTPTLALIVNRDREIKSFVPHDYFVPWVVLRGKRFTFKESKQEFQVYDTEGRITSREFAEKVTSFVKGAPWKIIESTSEQKTTPPPLPHNLSSLQQLMNKNYGYSANEVLSTCQDLYEKYKVATYPRTDCRHLPESMFEERGNVLKTLFPNFKDEVSACSKSIRSKCFNDKKVTAHFAIVPTGASFSMSQFSEKERNVFDAICRFYIAQFISDAVHLKDKVTVMFGGIFSFSAFDTHLLDPGWQRSMGKFKLSEAEGGEENSPE